jgi:hypothetical protein
MSETSDGAGHRIGQARKRVTNAESSVAMLQLQVEQGTAERDHPAWHGQIEALLRVRLGELTQARQQLGELISRPNWRFD